ncbi:MAG TPA: DHA2 family efflux MFS transporter permease subunit [Casimicrobiaceae bacterium]|nr:DHA2 family efflux MFS transporter permease subunit [Casimicrobiaceae bacterium]
MTTFAASPCDTGVIRGVACSAPSPPSASPWILAATIIASSMAFIDGTVVNVALPALQRELSATLVDVQWVVESYALFLAALLLVGGAAGDRFGRRRVFVIGVALFAAASVWCGLAGSVHQLIAARAVQGVGGALLVPGSLAIISASFDEQSRGKAIGTWSGASALMAALGPVFGGWLIDHLSWRAAFFINVPLAAAVLYLTLRHVPESSNADAQGDLDWQGASLVTLGLGGIVYGMIESPMKGWADPAVIIALIVGVTALAGFLIAERRQATPMLPLELFRSSTFSGANLLTFLLYGALGGSLFFLPLDLIQVHHYSTTAAGAALLPFVLLLSLLSRWSGGLINRYGAQRPLIVGPIIVAVGFALFAVPGTSGNYWLTFFPASVVLGLGMAISVAPLTTAVLNAVDARFAGAASGINNAASRVSALIAVAVFGLIMTPIFNRTLDAAVQRTTPDAAIIAAIDQQRGRLAAIELPENVDAQAKTVAQEAIAHAFVAGFRAIMLISAALALGGAASAWLLIRSSDPNR